MGFQKIGSGMGARKRKRGFGAPSTIVDYLKRRGKIGFHYNPNDAASLTKVTATKYLQSAGQYMTTPNHADFDLSNTDGASHSIFTVEVWLNQTLPRSNGRLICGQGGFNASDNGGWTLGFALGNGYNPYVLIGGNNNATSLLETGATNTAPITCIHFVYDGSQAEANRVKIYVNGVLKTNTASPAWPAQIQHAAALSFGLGTSGNMTSIGFQTFDGAIPLCRIWKNVALTAGNVSTLTASLREFVPYASLGALQTGVILSLENDATTDTATGKAFTKTNAPTSCTLVTQIRDLSGNGRHVNFNIGTAEYLDTIGDGPGLRSYFYQYGTTGTLAVDPITSTSGTIISMWQINEAPTTYSENFTLGFEQYDGNSTGKYAMLGYLNTAGTCNTQLRIRNNVSPNGSVVSDKVIAQDTPYIDVWQGRTTGGASSYRHLCNGTEHTTTITGTVAQNGWLDDVTGKDQINLSAFGINNSATAAAIGIMRHTLGQQLGINGDITEDELEAAIAYVDQDYNIW
jgi:hypothetical protein